MAVLQINTGPEGPRLQASPGALAPALRLALASTGPIVIMIHGYKFDPTHRQTCPHRHILSLSPKRDCVKAVSWPRGLGFSGQVTGEGLAIGFGWFARGTTWGAYGRAAQAGRALAELIEMIARLAPDRPLHLLAHYLGARVALTALPHIKTARVGRVILLSGADYGQTAREALQSPAGQSTENHQCHQPRERPVRFPAGALGDAARAGRLDTVTWNAANAQYTDPAAGSSRNFTGFARGRLRDRPARRTHLPLVLLQPARGLSALPRPLAAAR